MSHKKVITPTSRVIVQQSRSFSSPAKSVTSNIKRMDWEELNERNRLGLYFKKFEPGHRCNKLFCIQAILNDSDVDVEMEIEDSEATETSTISLHAISETDAWDTMRIKGILAHLSAIVLMDTGVRYRVTLHATRWLIVNVIQFIYMQSRFLLCYLMQISIVYGMSCVIFQISLLSQFNLHIN
ncbi:hypothetical protein CFOL_v3_26105 [Cephalotus follicularis]|uniref:Uncharacterized protein n=1 Tax=Cephalotus follicularis TaxID=3775 RepID=A0A1Q3CQY5_CEPFO|nr:hypothetical protein CFOL_v3_26105 [Cephalotus follicularis]